MPILIFALGMVALMYFKKPSSTALTSSSRTVKGIGGSSGSLPTSPAAKVANQGAASGTTKQAGNANQPWYNGAVVAGAGVGATAIAKGLSSAATSLFSSSGEPEQLQGDDFDDSDLEACEEEMGNSSASSTDDNEDFSDDDGYSDASDE